MKTDYWIVCFVILLLMGIAGIFRVRTVMEVTIEQQEQEIVKQEQEIANLKNINKALQPPPYHEPMEGAFVSSGTGYRLNPMGGSEEALHKGRDLVKETKEGEKPPIVYAALSGRVVSHWLVPGMHNGKMYYGDPFLGAKIVIDHGDGLFSIYGHLSETRVHEDDWVEMGQPIGRVGNTGISTGPHLHFEIVVDPIRYLKERNGYMPIEGQISG